MTCFIRADMPADMCLLEQGAFAELSISVGLWLPNCTCSAFRTLNFPHSLAPSSALYLLESLEYITSPYAHNVHAAFGLRNAVLLNSVILLIARLQAYFL
jgi:hypothetical protein